MSLESDALDEISKATDLNPDPWTFYNRCVERMEDLVIKATGEEFLDPDKVAAFSRWSHTLHLRLLASLPPPPKPGIIERFLPKENPPIEPGGLRRDLALAIGALAANVYTQMVRLSKEKKVTPALWNDEQKHVDRLIERIEARQEEMCGAAAAGLPGFAQAVKIRQQYQECKAIITGILTTHKDNDPEDTAAKILTAMAAVKEASADQRQQLSRRVS